MTLNCIWRVWSTSSLPLLPGPLWLGVVVPSWRPVYGSNLFDNYIYLIKGTCWIVDFAIPGKTRSKIKIKRKEINIWLDLAWELKKKKETMEHESDGDTNYNWYTWNNPQMIGKGTGRLENKRASGDHPDYSIIKIGLNTEKSPGDLRRLAVTQTPERNHQLTLVWKTLKKEK